MPRKTVRGGKGSRGFLRGLGRFNYWGFIPQFMPRSHEQHLPLSSALLNSFRSDRFRDEHIRGDRRAIFRYVAQEVGAFQADWVVDQVVRWRMENTQESRNNLRLLMRAYTSGESGRGSRMGTALLDRIKFDIGFVRAVIEEAGKAMEQRIKPASIDEAIIPSICGREPFRLSVEMGRQIWDEYRRAMSRYFTIQGTKPISVSTARELLPFCDWSERGLSAIREMMLKYPPISHPNLLEME